MRFGDTHVLAEVGVGINLAFGTIQSFRTWLIERVNSHLQATNIRIGTALSEIKEAPPSNGTSLRQAAAVVEAFNNASEAFERNFITSAIVAVVLLISYIACATIFADDCCPWFATMGILAADLGVVGVWSLLLCFRYVEANGELLQIEQHCLAGVDFVKQELTAEIRPPGTTLQPRKHPAWPLGRKLMVLTAIVVVGAVVAAVAHRVHLLAMVFQSP